MKAKHLFTAVLIAFLSTSCAHLDKVVSYPFIEKANTRSVDIYRVELTDTATVLHVNADFSMSSWIRISSKGYLQADGKRYALKGSDGFSLDTEVPRPENMDSAFRLFFEPLPRHIASFDYIEADDCPGCFRLYGVNLQSPGKSASKEPYQPTGVPAEVLQIAPMDSVPAPIFEVGETTINVHILGYKPEWGSELNLYVDQLFGFQEPHSAQVDAETGTATLRFMLYGSATAIVRFGNNYGCFWIAPNDTTDVWFDPMRYYARDILDYRSQRFKIPFPVVHPYLYTTGKYADMNQTLSRRSDYDLNYIMDVRRFVTHGISADEYTQTLIEEYKFVSDSVARLDDSPLMKDYWQLLLKQQTLYAIVFADYLREMRYRYDHDNYDWDYKVEGIDSIRPEHVASVCSLFDINDPKLLMPVRQQEYISALSSPLVKGKKGIFSDIIRTMDLHRKAVDGNLSQEDLDSVKALGTPFLLQTFEKKYEIQQQQLAEMQVATIETTPDVPDEELLDAILAPYKGKIVLVDFWNTWCGPCRMALKAIEPLKDELKSDQLVWLYIADESSPELEYNKMVPGIQGKHYRLTKKQWNHVTDQVGIKYIPSYLLVDENGRYELREDFTDHNVLKDELAKIISGATKCSE